MLLPGRLQPYANPMQRAGHLVSGDISCSFISGIKLGVLSLGGCESQKDESQVLYIQNKS